MIRCLILAATVVLLLLPATPVSAQKLKLPSLLPFKKQTTEVKPFRLTDQAKGPPGTAGGGPIMKFLTPAAPGQRNSRLTQLNQQTRDFLTRTGESITRLAADTRDQLQEWESPGWDFRNHKNWWEEPAPAPDTQQLFRDFSLLKKLNSEAEGTPPRPPPRTARDFQNNPPRHRF